MNEPELHSSPGTTIDLIEGLSGSVRELAVQFCAMQEVQETKTDTAFILRFAEHLQALDQFDEAREVYEQIIANDRECVPALLGIARLERTQRQLRQAVRFYQRALTRQSSAAVRTELGRVLVELREYSEARAAFEGALEEDPLYIDARRELLAVERRVLTTRVQNGRVEDLDTVDPLLSTDELFTRGIKYMAESHHGQARQCFELAIERRPDFREALLNLGNVNFNDKAYDDALECYCRAIEIRPDFHEAFFNLGNVLLHLERYDDAILHFRRALELKPDHVPILLQLGSCHSKLGRSQDAIDLYKRVLELQPESTSAYIELGNLFRRVGKMEDAERQYRKVIELRPDLVEGYFQTANVLRDRNRVEDAIVTFEQALRIQPNMPAVLNNLGNAYMAVEQFDRAREIFERIVELEPNGYAALSNLGNAYMSARQMDLALATYDRAIALDPENREGLYNKAFGLLLLGRYQEGWAAFESRLNRSNTSSSDPEGMMWDGSNLSGKTIFVALEQGMGDCLHCVRFVPQLLAQGARVLLEYRDPFKRLFETIPDVELVKREQKPAYDYWVLVMSLPHFLGNTMENIPAEVPYLHVPPGATKQIPPSDRPKVGVIWKGNPHQGNDRNRSTVIERFAKIFSIPDLTFYVLQKELTVQELEFLADRPHVHVLSDMLGDFGDTANVISQLDLTITIDTSIAHLAGALGRPVWVLLCYNASWQYLLNRDDNPWYPTMRTLRQHEPRSWDNLIDRTGRALQEHFGLERLPEDYTEDEQIDLAERYFALGNLREAARIAETCQPETPRYAEALHLLAKIAQRKGQHETAIELAARAVLLNDMCIAYQLTLARSYAACDDHEVVRAIYRRVRELAPHDPIGLVHQGRYLLSVGMFEQAQQCAQDALAQAPEDPDAYLLRAQAAFRTGDMASAVADATQTIQLAPRSVDHLMEAVDILESEDRPAEIEELLRRAAALSPESDSVLNRLADFLLRHDRSAEVVDLLEPNIPLMREQNRSRRTLARAYVTQQRFRDALDHLLYLAERAPSDAELLCEIGSIFFAHCATFEAQAAYRRALRADPGYAPAYQGLLSVYHAEGNVIAAARIRTQAARRAVKLDPQGDEHVDV